MVVVGVRCLVGLVLSVCSLLLLVCFASVGPGQSLLQAFLSRASRFSSANVSVGGASMQMPPAGNLLLLCRADPFHPSPTLVSLNIHIDTFDG